MRMLPVVLLAIALSGCANLPVGNDSTELGKALLKDLQGCTRDYNGAVGAGVTLSVQVHCDPTKPTS